MSFDKLKALAELSVEIDEANKVGGLLGQLRVQAVTTEYLQKVYDEGYKAGFERGIAANEVVDDLNPKEKP